jgi:hypothetical protein
MVGNGDSRDRGGRHSPGGGRDGGFREGRPGGRNEGSRGGGGGGGGSSGSGGARRSAPPESTGAEVNYLFKNKEARTAMVLRLEGGDEVRGIIEYYDRDMIKINRQSGPNLFIRKSQIRYMYKDPEGGTG